MDNSMTGSRLKNKIQSVAIAVQKNKKLLISATIFVFLIVYLFIFTILFLPKKNQKLSRSTSRASLPAVPSVNTPTAPEVSGEVMTSVRYDLNCRIVITTNTRKIYLEKIDTCAQALSSTISPDGKYIDYILNSTGGVSRIIVYSLANNIGSLIATKNTPILTIKFDRYDNLAILSTGTFSYYFIPLLFQSYPNNFDQQAKSFIDLKQKTVDITIPQLAKAYQSITFKSDKSDEIDLIDNLGKMLYIVSYSDLNAQLTPSQSAGIMREKLDWSKRILVYDNGAFKTSDLNGEVSISHPFICNNQPVIPLGLDDDLFARSPDGTELVFLIPTDSDQNKNPNWRNDILTKKATFNQGLIVLYDLIHDTCTVSSMVQTPISGSSFSISPSGDFLAYVNGGLLLYHFQERKKYQLTSHDLRDSQSPAVINGPPIWDAQSKFIYMTLSNQTLVRVYFDENFKGSEQKILDLSTPSALYAVSPDGNHIVYLKDQNFYIYNLADQTNAFLTKQDSRNEVTKIVWLRNRKIVTDRWIADENLNIIPITADTHFQIDFGENIILSGQNSTVSSYDLVHATIQNTTLTGQLLKLYY